MQGSLPKVGENSHELLMVMQSGLTPQSKLKPQMESVPAVIPTLASATLPTNDSGSMQRCKENSEQESGVCGSLLLAPIGAAVDPSSGRPASPLDSYKSSASNIYKNKRLWVSFPDQSLCHPQQRKFAEHWFASTAMVVDNNNAAQCMLYATLSSTTLQQ
uniref:Uncharacterized protein n=1 Tax=Melanopsichium pennsylvanicum 4 TaxID=1398559 RepID=A0A077QQN8_9BASI|nr:putative protein [Melanopsichium pennsylvanicum 4]